MTRQGVGGHAKQRPAASRPRGQPLFLPRLMYGPHKRTMPYTIPHPPSTTTSTVVAKRDQPGQHHVEHEEPRASHAVLPPRLPDGQAACPRGLFGEVLLHLGADVAEYCTTSLVA